MFNQPPNPAPQPSSSQPPSSTPSPMCAQISVRTWIAAMFLLPLIGLLLGAIVTALVSAAFEVYQQVSGRQFTTLLEMLTNIIFSLINVLAIAGSSITTGARVGIFSGSITALTVVLLALVNGQIRFPLRKFTTIGLTLSGAIGAWYGAIADSHALGGGALLAYLIGGALFGLLAAQSILPKKD